MGKRITITNYNKCEVVSPISDWDVMECAEWEEEYFFQLCHRTHNDVMIYITLSRIPQYAPLPLYPDKMLQCYITDGDGDFCDRSWFREWDLSYKHFWECVGEVIRRYERTMWQLSIKSKPKI